MIIDSHMHINSKVLDDTKSYINLINNNDDIFCVINVGLDIDTSLECTDISANNSKFYSSIGIHPLYIDNQNIDLLFNMVTDKVVAIGEIGLDASSDNYYEQKTYLIEQIMLANALCLPVIIHSGNSNKKVIDIFEKYVKPEYGCVFHCFQPDLDDLEYLVSNGYYISFAGRITFKNAKKSHDVLSYVPNNLFLIETDSPFISPEPVRYEINKTENINYIIDKISDLKSYDREAVIKITSDNTKRLFKKIKSNIV